MAIYSNDIFCVSGGLSVHKEAARNLAWLTGNSVFRERKWARERITKYGRT